MKILPYFFCFSDDFLDTWCKINRIREKVIRETYNRYKELIKELDEEYYNSKTNHSERF